MVFFNRFVLLQIFLFLSTSLLAALPNEESKVASISTPVSSPEGKIIGTLDIRPSDVFKETDSFRFENSISLGYRFAFPLQILYQQELWTNLSDSPTLPGSPQGTVFARDGFFSVLSDKFWTSEDRTVFLTYEGRAYLPTFAARRSAGMLTAVRNYFTLGKKLNPVTTVSITETPVVHVFNQNAFSGKANPLFENRMQAKVSFQLTDQLALGFPLIWQATKMRTSLGASKSGVWDHYLWINPEILYALNTQTTLGLAYYDLGSLTKNDLSDLSIMEGLRDGVVQFIFKASL